MSENLPESTPPAGPGPEGTTPPATPPADPAAPPAQETDWKAEARKHEKRAKENFAAVEELAKLKTSMQTDSEKAIAAAKSEGATEAAKTFGARLAAAEFKAAVAAKGLDLGEALDLIDASKFVDDKGDVDDDAIKKAVAKLAKLAPAKGAGRSGGEFTGAPGEGAPITEEQLNRMTPEQIAKAYAEGKLKHLM